VAATARGFPLILKVVPDLVLVKAVDGRAGLYDSRRFSLFQFCLEVP